MAALQVGTVEASVLEGRLQRNGCNWL